LADSPAILFPHTRIERFALVKLLSQFHPLVICLPWLIKTPPLLKEKDYVAHIKIQRPPKDQAPGDLFEKTLAEYKLWISGRQDKGFTAFLSKMPVPGISKESIWQIKQMIRRIEKGTPAETYQKSSFKSHLLLHLSSELEETCLESERMLSKLKSQKSPLAEALEQESSPPPILEDLPLPDNLPSLEPRLVEPALEAWVHLFGAFLSGNESLITFDHQIFNYVMDCFSNDKERGILEQGVNKKVITFEKSTDTIFLKKVHLPSVKKNSANPENMMLSFLSGRTVFLVKNR
jgi:hypothetical protein